jgi:hypothetical protein
MFLKYCSGCFVTKEEFEDTNGIIKTRINTTANQVRPFCNLQSRARTHAVLVIGLYELLGNPTT